MYQEFIQRLRELGVQQDYKHWCEQHGKQWTLQEEVSASPFPHGNFLFEAIAMHLTDFAHLKRLAPVHRKIITNFKTVESAKLFYDYLAGGWNSVSIKDKSVITEETVPFLEEIWRGINETNIEKYLISIVFEETEE